MPLTQEDHDILNKYWTPAAAVEMLVKVKEYGEPSRDKPPSTYMDDFLDAGLNALSAYREKSGHKLSEEEYQMAFRSGLRFIHGYLRTSFREN